MRMWATNRNRGLINEYHRAEALKDSSKYAPASFMDRWWVERLLAERLWPSELNQDKVLQIKIDEIIKHKQSNDPICENSVWDLLKQHHRPCAFWDLLQNPEYLSKIRAAWRIRNAHPSQEPLTPVVSNKESHNEVGNKVPE